MLRQTGVPYPPRRIETQAEIIPSHLIRIIPAKGEKYEKDNDENAVEYEIADKANTSIRKLFIDKYDLCLFNHQLHVGVKSQKSLLFPGGQSAIDLWGVSNSKETLCVFELKYINKQKKNKNIKNREE